jgi:hypothetical protein
VRALFGPRFGVNFSGVRVHTNGRAAQLAQAVNARAFTVGRDIVFGAGEYDPMAMSSRRLLAHELVHMMQQSQQADGNSKPVRRKSKHSFEDCGNSEQVLEAASKDAVKTVSKAEAVVGSGYGRPKSMKANTLALLNTHFHTTKRNDLLSILREYIKITKAFENGVDFECENTCKAGKEVRTCGYAYTTQVFGGFGDVHICFDTRAGHCHFVNSLNAQERQALLIHEVAHRYAGIDDKAYVWENAYPTLSPKKAMDNADSYAWFAVQL